MTVNTKGRDRPLNCTDLAANAQAGIRSVMSAAEGFSLTSIRLTEAAERW